MVHLSGGLPAVSSIDAGAAATPCVFAEVYGDFWRGGFPDGRRRQNGAYYGYGADTPPNHLRPMATSISNLAEPKPEFTAERLQRLKVELHEQLVNEMNFSVLRSLPPEALRAEIRGAAERICLSTHLLTQNERSQLVDEVLAEMTGLGPLESLMQDDRVSDVLINGPDCVYVERAGRLESTGVRFRDLDHLVETVQRLVGRVGRRLDEANPMVDARLPDGSRINAVIRPLAIEGALVSIRRFGAKQLDAADLIRLGACPPKLMNFLSACIEGRRNIVISGGTGSGKTTLLNVLSSFIPASERVLTIEDAAELQLQQPHVARMETRVANLEGRGATTTRDLLKNALRMRPDRIIVGECRGDEALDMLQAMSTGHNGGLSTVHANDAADAVGRLEMLIGLAAPELPMWLIQRQIASSLNLIVHVARVANGRRQVVQVAEVVGTEGNQVQLRDRYRVADADWRGANLAASSSQAMSRPAGVAAGRTGAAGHALNPPENNLTKVT